MADNRACLMQEKKNLQKTRYSFFCHITQLLNASWFKDF